MAIYKITDLPTLDTVDPGDFVPIVDDPGGTPVTKKTTVASLLAGAGGGEAFPVGSVFIAVVDTNPATLLGYGTWQAIAAGRMLVGVNAGDPDFDTLEETGGAKTHTLTESEMPAHTHVENSNNTTTGALRGWGAPDASTNSSTATGYSTAPAGGGQAHNNLPPFFVVRMWKRTS